MHRSHTPNINRSFNQPIAFVNKTYHIQQRLALPLALRCGAPGGPVLLDSLKGDARFRRLWAAVVSPGHQDR